MIYFSNIKTKWKFKLFCFFTSITKERQNLPDELSNKPCNYRVPQHRLRLRWYKRFKKVPKISVNVKHKSVTRDERF